MIRGLWWLRIQGSLFKELQMHKQKTYLHLMSGILVLLFTCRAGYLQASDQPEKARVEVASAEATAPANAEASVPANPSPATLASEINAMKELIDIQRRQIEKLQSALEKQQLDLNKTMSAVEAKSAPLSASAAISSAPAQQRATSTSAKPAAVRPAQQKIPTSGTDEQGRRVIRTPFGTIVRPDRD